MPRKKKTAIKSVFAREILDSRGNPTVEAEIILIDGTKAWAHVPSGASTGAFEAHELRDGDDGRYGGKGVLSAVAYVKGEIAEAVIGMDVCAQEALDEKMIALDGTKDKSRLGANAILAVSLAACRAAAVSKEMPLYAYIAMLHGTKELAMPTPMFNVINGGQHADSGLAIQEYKVVPHGIETFREQYRAGSEIFHELKRLLKDAGLTTAVGDEGGFAPRLESNESPFFEIITATENAGYSMGKEIGIGIDAAANSFYEEKCGHYAFRLEHKAMNREQLIQTYQDWIDRAHLISVEDGLHEEDWEGWSILREKIGSRAMIIGDDLLVTNVVRLRKAIKHKACTAVLIKPNQIGTLTETLACMALAQKHKMQTVVSHRSGETIDDFIADLAVGAGAEFIKTGSLSRGERICKYNRLLTIEDQITA